MPREFRKFLYRLDRKDYRDALDIVSKAVNDLEALTRLSVALEPNRRKRSGGRVISMLRDLSSSVYRALRSSILCQCSSSHDVSLGLSPRFADVGYEDNDEKVMSDTNFRVAISYETKDQDPERKKMWDEVDIRWHPVIANTQTPIPTLLVQTPPPETTKPRRARFVAFAKTQTTFVTSSMASTSSGKAPKSIEIAVANMTQSLQVTSITVTDSPGTSRETRTASAPPFDLCKTLRKSYDTRPDCYGQLVDSACPEHCFKVCPLETTNSSSAWSIITLNDVLWRKQGLQPLLWLEEKVRLALAVASAVLQLNKTPWLSEPLTKRDVHFFNRGGWPGYQQPFLRRQIPEPIHISCGQGEKRTPVQPNNTIFCLGILLLEIIMGSTLENMREPHERIEFQGDRFGIIRDSITAHRLLQTQVSLINPAYKAVVERCVGCGSSQGLDEEGFRERVYNGVVAELEAILECTKLS